MDNETQDRGGSTRLVFLIALVIAALFLLAWLTSDDSAQTAESTTDTSAETQNNQDGDDGQESDTTTTTATPTTSTVAETTATTAPPTTTAGANTLGTTISETADLSSINAVLEVLGLRETLDSGEYTFFAPPNTSFVEVDRDLLAAITADQDQLMAVALNHVVEGEVSSLRTLDGPLQTLGGTELIFEVVNDEVVVLTEAGPVVVQENRIVVDNGVIHGVDGILLSGSDGVAPSGPTDVEPVDDPDEVEEPVEEPEEPVEEPVEEPEEPVEEPGTPNETVDAIAALLELEPVQFDDSSADIKSESLETLDRVVEILTEDPSTRLEVAGHTDDIGPADGNQRWSERRARSVRDYLVAQGIDGERLVAVGYGENQPIADNATEEGRAENRRIEFTLLP